MQRNTNVTIISTNLSKNILKEYREYEVIDKYYQKEDLLNYENIIFFNSLNNLKDEEIKELYQFLKDNHINYINVTNDIEEVLFTDYLIVYNKNKIVIEGNTIEVLKNEKLLKRIGLELPFIVELSLLLKDYSLIDKIYLDKESLVKELW